MARILLIDDDPDARLLAAMVLGTLGGHDVIEANSGAGGVALAQQDPPDVVVVDMRMPRMDGPATITALRSSVSTRDVPVVVMTATTEQAEHDEVRELGVAAIIVKPFDPTTLPEQVEAVIRGEA